MIVMAIVILLVVFFASSIESNLTKTFKDPEWMNIKEEEEK